MSADPIYTVWCDHEGCGEWCGAQDASCTTAGAARDAAKKAGWRVAVPARVAGHTGFGQRRLDYCPEHAAASKLPSA